MNIHGLIINRLSYIRNVGLILVLVIPLFVMNCKKDDDFQFGYMQDGFLPDSIYNATTDGLLYIEFVNSGKWFNLDDPIAEVFCSTNPDSLKSIAFVYMSSTLPIRKNNYWMVDNLTFNDLKITWTPID